MSETGAHIVPFPNKHFPQVTSGPYDAEVVTVPYERLAEEEPVSEERALNLFTYVINAARECRAASSANTPGSHAGLLEFIFNQYMLTATLHSAKQALDDAVLIVYAHFDSLDTDLHDFESTEF